MKIEEMIEQHRAIAHAVEQANDGHAAMMRQLSIAFEESSQRIANALYHLKEDICCQE